MRSSDPMKGVGCLRQQDWVKLEGAVKRNVRTLGRASLGKFDSELPVLSLRSDSSRDRTAAKLKILFLG